MEKKLQYLDVARGIAILLVVLGHALIKDFASSNVFINYLRFYVYTIHMPIFFVISGMLFERNIDRYCKNSKYEYVKNKFCRFMIPYFSFSILNYLIVFFFSNFNYFSSILNKEGFVISSFSKSLFSIITYINHIDNHLWFLYVMFIILLLNRLFFFNFKCKEKKVIIIIISIIIYCISLFISPFAPEIVYKIMYYNIIFVFGRLSYMYCFLFKNTRINFFNFIICLIFSIFLLFIKDSREVWFYPLVNLIVELSASLWVIYYLGNLFLNNKVLNYFGNGKKSMIIYLLHMPFILPFIIFLLIRLNVNVFIIVPISFVTSIVVCLFFYNFILCKSKAVRKYLFGFVN